MIELIVEAIVCSIIVSISVHWLAYFIVYIWKHPMRDYPYKVKGSVKDEIRAIVKTLNLKQIEDTYTAAVHINSMIGLNHNTRDCIGWTNRYLKRQIRKAQATW